MTEERIRKNRKTIKESLDRAALAVNVVSATVAVLAAAAAFWSGYEAHKTRVDDERPLLIGEPANRMSSPTFMKIRISNIGKSSAKNLHVACKSGIDSKNSPILWQDQDLKAPVANFSYLHPALWVEVDCPSTTQYVSGASGTVVELGAIQYEDMHSNNYTTPFCVTYTVPTPNIDVHLCEDARNLPPLE